MKLFLGNLPWSATEADIRDAFAPRNIQEVKVITDRETGRSRGFAFVTLPDAEGKAAIELLHGSQFMGRSLVVNEANERSNSGGGGPRGGRNDRRPDHDARGGRRRNRDDY